mgnify:CR=1 FL=1
MVSNLHPVSKNNNYNFEKFLPSLSLISVTGITFGLIFSIYFYIIKLNYLFAFSYFIFFVIGVTTAIFIELKTKKIEQIKGYNDFKEGRNWTWITLFILF